MLTVTDLQAGSIKLRDVVGILSAPNFKEFVLFLQLSEVYSSGYLDDVDYNKFNLRGAQTHREAMIRQLEKIL